MFFKKNHVFLYCMMTVMKCFYSRMYYSVCVVLSLCVCVSNCLCSTTCPRLYQYYCARQLCSREPSPRPLHLLVLLSIQCIDVLFDSMSRVRESLHAIKDEMKKKPLLILQKKKEAKGIKNFEKYTFIFERCSIINDDSKGGTASILSKRWYKFLINV